MDLSQWLSDMPEIVNANYHAILWGIGFIAGARAAWFFFADLNWATNRAKMMRRK